MSNCENKECGSYVNDSVVLNCGAFEDKFLLYCDSYIIPCTAIGAKPMSREPIEYLEATTYASVQDYINEIEDVIYPKIRSLEKDYLELEEKYEIKCVDKLFFKNIGDATRRITDASLELTKVMMHKCMELEKKLEKMKCCENCAWGIMTTNHTLCNKHIKNPHLIRNCNKWELKGEQNGM